jgi:hypothetical protein
MKTIKYIENTSDDFEKHPTRSHLARTSYGTFSNYKALGLNVDGYGRKIRTIWKVPFKGRLYRVYATCFSNVSSHWILSKGEKLFIRN